MSLRDRRAAEARIDIAPLIDVVFILLIFFMVTTTFVRERQLPVTRPGATGASAQAAQILRVEVDPLGEVYVDGLHVPAYMLQARVREHLVRRGIDRVLLAAAPGLDSGRLVEVMDDCRLAGAIEVGVALVGEL